jgi:hypothetical protein
MLLPDLPSAACIAVSGLIVYLVDGNFVNTKLHCAKNSSRVYVKTSRYLFLGGVALGLAYLIRETALFFGVFVIGYMVYQTLSRKTIQWSWLWFWLGFLTVVGLELGYYYWMTGYPFYRYLSVESSVKMAKPMELLKRHFHGVSLLRYLSFDRFRVLFYIPDFSFYYFFVFAGIIYGIYKRIPHLRYFIGWFLTLFLLYSFGSKSLVAYIPFRSVPRYFLALSVPGVIIMTKYFQEMAAVLTLKHRKDLKPFLLSLAIAWILMFVINLFWFSVIRMVFLFGILLLLLIVFSETLRTWFRGHLPPKYLGIVIPLILLYINILPGIYITARGKRPRKGITCERDIRQLLEFPLTHTIYTDSRTEVILEYFYQYQYDDLILQFDDTDVRGLKNTYVVANWERVLFLNRVYYTPIPDFLYYPPPSWRIYARIGACVIYEIP